MKDKAIAFGGNTMTLTDFALAMNVLQIEGSLNSELLKKQLSIESSLDFGIANKMVAQEIREKIEKLVDKLKTENKDIPVIACGGGAFLLPNKIEGASEVIFPDNMEVANAFGASIAQVSAETEIVINSSQKNEDEEMGLLLLKLKSRIIEDGAKPESIKILTKSSTPLAYLPSAVKLKIKICGDLE